MKKQPLFVRIMNINILCVLIVIGFFYFLTIGMGVNQILIAMMLVISPIWLLTLAVIPQSKSMKIFNIVSMVMCFIIGIWLTVDLKMRPTKCESMSGYTITEKLNLNTEKVNGKDNNDTISDILIVTFQKDYMRQFVQRSDLSKNIKLDSLKVYHQYKIDIFNEKFGCGIYIDDNGRKVYTQNYDRR